MIAKYIIETVTHVAHSGSVPCDETSGTGRSGALPTGTSTSSRTPWSIVPTNGWNATASSADSPVAISTSCTESETVPTVVLSPMPSLPPPVSAVTEPFPAATASEIASELPTGATVECISMTTLTMSSRTFSWCAQVATVGPSNANAAPSQTAAFSTPNSGGYAFSGRDNLELPGPSTLSTVVVRSPSLVPRSTVSSETPSPEACGNKADVGDFTLNVSGKDPSIK
ncbi:hypothetical protein PC116_g29188 [Phytophthora cactorum]|nr:hypothetical protein PC116_g29188 [Phytophthora cactorum]